MTYFGDAQPGSTRVSRTRLPRARHDREHKSVLDSLPLTSGVAIIDATIGT